MKTPEMTVLKDFSKGDLIENFRVDADGSLKRRDGCVLMTSFPAVIRGLLSVREDVGEVIYLVAATTLYRYAEGVKTALGTLDNAVFQSESEHVEMFMFAGKLYILGGGDYFCYDGETLAPVDGYIPLIRRGANGTDQGYAYEPQNLLTNKVRMRFFPNSSTTQFRLYGDATSIDAVYVSGQKRETGYSLVNNTSGSHLKLSSTIFTNTEDIIEVFYTLANSSQREKITSCRHSAVYGGDTDSRVFLYGGENKAVIYPTDPENGDGQTVISAEYFPMGGEITVGDGNLFVTGAVRQFDRLAIFTEDAAFYTYPHKDEDVNGLERYSFPILPLNSDVGASKEGGAILVENEPFALNENGLYRFKSTSVRDERLAILVEAPAFAGFSRAFIESCRLYVNRLRGELWCYGMDGEESRIVVYNARTDVWYRFTGITPDLMFTYEGDPAFTVDGLLFRFQEGLNDDSGVGFDAVFESGALSLGNAFGDKTLYECGMALECADGASLSMALSSNHGDRVNLNFAADAGKDRRVLRAHARLGHVQYLSFSLTCPADAPPVRVREIMLRYREN